MRQSDLVASDIHPATEEELRGEVGVGTVVEHGEYGPLLVYRDQSFMTRREATRRRKP